MFDRLSEGRWWDKPWSLVEGCTPCSPACAHCWLRAMDRRFHHAGPLVRFRSDRLEIPLRRKVPTAWAIWSDLFHEAVTLESVRAAMDVMAQCPQHQFLVLTKRSERMRALLGDAKPIPNVALGVTAENQEWAKRRIPVLLKTPAAIRFVSLEPLLGPVNLHDYIRDTWVPVAEKDVGNRDKGHIPPLDWVIVGGESGPGARPMDPEWVRDIRRRCLAAGVPFFFKQWGGRGNAGRVLDGRTWDELPWTEEARP